MGMDASATISFGMEFEEDFEFPWEDQDIDDWWIKELGFEPSKEVFDENGNYNEGMTKKDSDDYFKEIGEFLENHPCPIIDIRCGSYDNHSTVIAIPSSCIYGDWESGVNIDTLEDFILDNENLNSYYEFMNKYFLDEFMNQKPRWILTCFWG
jgi:hypothetical protein